MSHEMKRNHEGSQKEDVSIAMRIGWFECKISPHLVD